MKIQSQLLINFSTTHNFVPVIQTPKVTKCRLTDEIDMLTTAKKNDERMDRIY